MSAKIAKRESLATRTRVRTRAILGRFPLLGAYLKRRDARRFAARRKADYEREIAAARKAGGDAVWHVQQSYKSMERFEAEEEDLEFSDTLVAAALELRVPLPPRPANREEDNEFWEFSSSFGRSYLTLRGTAEVREAISKEKARRAAERNAWIPWIATIMGAIGTGTGFLVALDKILNP